ncbi:hypothetical protein EsDP_00000038 [Epichloe bromicola]|uniref:Uncharacterized protein n=1 Tax=Epichloe bromicola TaxID=79588 RepID=A0ABQ0CDQ9_9HYPO
MKSVTVLLLTAGLVSAVVVPVQLAEREALQSVPGVDIPEYKHEVEKRAMKFAHLVARNGVQNGNVLQGIFTPAITGIINNMGLGQNVNVQAIQGLNFPNQIVVLNQLQQLQTLMQFNIFQRQQVVTFVGQGISNNGVKIALLKRDVDDLSTARTVAGWDT